MSAPIRAWIESQGMVAYGEVPHSYCSIDHVGLRDGDHPEVVVIESKLSLSKQVVHQAMLNQICGPSYVAVACLPRKKSLAVVKQHGLGLLDVYPRSVVERIKPTGRRYVWEVTKIALIKQLRLMESGGDGGIADRKGFGPAQVIHEQVRMYIQANAGVTWAVIFAEVPNHYVNARSLQGSMRILEDRTGIDRLPKIRSRAANRVGRSGSSRTD